MPTVKPAPKPTFRQTTLTDVVRRAEGPMAYARRKRYVEYEFGGGRGKPRKFWGNTDGTR
jgi:hypothetical protein